MTPFFSRPCPSLSRRTALRTLGAGLLAGSGTAWSQGGDKPLLLRYAGTGLPADALDRYPLALLRMALGKLGHAVDLRPGERTLPQGRALLELETGRELDIAWSMTSREREAAVLPVRVCLYKGLMGWRVPMVREVDLPRFSQVQNLEQLRGFVAAQGHDWPDLDILRANGLRVEGATVADGYFKLLAMGRIDFFPLEIAAAFGERPLAQDLPVCVEPRLALHYPAPCYFFVSPRRPELARQLREGLELALTDGSFDRLFQQHFRGVLQAARLGSRQIIELDNPMLPPATPLARKRLWWTPNEA